MAGLKSELFRDNDRLQRCLVDDRAHVTQGSSGTFVNLIQFAILTLQGGFIEGGELQSMRYGKTTAKLVLDYKRRKKIINTSYQTTADDIVGKMTIKTLDDEMVKVEAAERVQQAMNAVRSRI